MSQLPPENDAFTKYYQQYLRQYGGSSGLAPIQPLDVGAPGGGEKLGFLGRTLDILSRPLRIVTNPVMKTLQLPEKFQEFAAREAAGENVSLGEKFGAVAGASWPVASVQGLVSDNPENKPYTSDIIEQVSDTWNINNPNYVDTEDNVNPIAKGVLGFVGDVALDPLTWVPGAAFATIAGKVGRGVGAVSRAASAGMKAARNTAEEVVEDVADVARQGDVPPAGASFDDVSKVENPAQATDFIRQKIDDGTVRQEGIVSGLRQMVNDSKITPKGAKPVSRRFKIDQFLKQAQKDLFVPKITVPGRLLDKQSWFDEVEKLADEGKLTTVPTRMTQVGDFVWDEPTLQSLLDVGKAMPEEELNALIGPYIQQLSEEVFDPYYEAYVRNFELNPNVNIFGEVADDGETLTGAAAAVARIAQLRDVELDNARFIFNSDGNNLFEAIRGLDEAGMAKFLDDSQYVLSKNGIVEGMGEYVKNSINAKLLRSFGISAQTYRAARADMEKRLANIVNGEPPKPVDEAVSNLSDDDGFIEYLREMLRREVITNRPDQLNFNNIDLLDDLVKAISRSGSATLKTNFDKEFLEKNYKFILQNGEIKVLKTKPEYGAGVARVQDTYGSFTQMTFFKNLGQQMSLLLKGVPLRAADGRRLRDAKNNVLYEELPKYLKNPRIRRAYEGFELSRNLESMTLQSMRTYNDYIAARGIPVTIDAIIGGERIVEPLRFEDIYEVLSQAIPDQRLLRLVLFNGDTGMDVTLLGDAAIAAMRGSSKEEIVGILRRGTNRWNNKPNNNWLAKQTAESLDDYKYYFGHQTSGVKSTKYNDLGFRYAPNIKDGKLQGYYIQWDPAIVADRLADTFVAKSGTLNEVAALRRAQYAARGMEDYRVVAPMVAQNLVDMFRDPTRAGEALLAVRNLGKMIKDFVKPIDAGEVGSLYSAEALNAVIPKAVRDSARTSEQMADAMKTGNREDVVNARQKRVKDDADILAEVDEKAALDAEEVLLDPSRFDAAQLSIAESIPEYAISNTVLGKDPLAGIYTSKERLLSGLSGVWRMGTKDHLSAFNLFHAPGRQTQAWAKRVENRLRRIKNIPGVNGTVEGQTPILVKAIKNIQTGVKAADEVNPVVRQAQALLEREIALLFGNANKLVKTIAATTFQRAGLTLDELARTFENFAVLGKSGDVARLPEKGGFIDFDLAARVAEQEGIDIVSAGLQQWKTWGDIEDPIGFIARTNAAMMNVATKAAFIDNFMLDMIPRGLASMDPKVAKTEKFVKLVSDGKSHFGSYLPPNMYVHPDIAYIFNRMDEALRTSRSLESPMGRWWTDTMDPFMLTWKYTVTVVRLGHHIRNEIGGQSMRWIALGSNGFARAERNAYRILGKENIYQGVDIARGLTRMGERVVAGGENIITGKLGPLSEKEIWADFKNSLQAVGKQAEDIYDEGLQGGAKRAADVIGAVATLGAGTRGGRVERLALGVSEFVENKARLAHYLQVLDQLSQGKPMVRGIGRVVYPKTMAEAREYAIESAFKFHPDPNRLTFMEARYARRIFPFYSWYKQALVALVENAVINPARTITTIPKASYNLAIAMGVDPYSLYNPFPGDQMFPSFLTAEMTGPQFEYEGRYISVNPGFANMDVFSDTFSDPVAGVVSMTSPIIRTPIELLAGSRLGTQAPIRDVSDFIDSSIPGINYVSNITGRSVTGGFEEQSRIASGDKTAFDQWLSAFNWAFGLGVRNYSRPSYINFAEIEARNEAAQ